MAELRHAFVTGYPVKHSRSPLIHGFWLDRYKIEGSYRAIEVKPEDFEDFIKGLEKQGLCGGNVTIPHKEAAFKLSAKPDAAAQAIGAANTLWLENGVLHASNSDAYGFAANLDDLVPEWTHAGSALVLGAGGASRAIIHALKMRGITDIHIVNRTHARACELAEHFGVSAQPWHKADDLVGDVDLIINTTSLGMSGHEDDHGESDDFPLSFDKVRPGTIATDIIYVPLQTPFLKKAAKFGLKTADGLGMLLHQAVPGFERWFGIRPQVDEELRALILKDMNEI